MGKAARALLRPAELPANRARPETSFDDVLLSFFVTSVTRTAACGTVLEASCCKFAAKCAGGTRDFWPLGIASAILLARAMGNPPK